MIRTDIEWDYVRRDFLTAEPFNHVVIDDFWLPEVADKLYEEFPAYDDATVWNAHYQNPIENKKACNHWDKFPKTTYTAFNFLSCDWLQDKIRFVADKKDLFMDTGLHGGGWHIHANGGNLNMHLDYNLHPKMGFQRKLNIIIYMTKDWDPAWGGGLELWTHDHVTGRPNEHAKTIDLKFNRAVLFDTTQNSWHGLPYPLTCPEGQTRKSLAAYYLGNAPSGTTERYKALFAPREDQKGNRDIEDFIVKRSSENFTKWKQGQ